MLWPRTRGTMVDRDLGQAHSRPRRDRGNEAVHLAVEPQAARQLAAHHLERAAVVVQRHPRRPRDQAVREERGDPLRERVVPRPAPAADHVEVVLLEPGHEPRNVRRIVLQVAVRGHDQRRRASARSPPRTRPSARSSGAGSPRGRAGRAARARGAPRACRRRCRRRPAPARTAARAARAPRRAAGAAPARLSFSLKSGTTTEMSTRAASSMPKPSIRDGLARPSAAGGHQVDPVGEQGDDHAHAHGASGERAELDAECPTPRQQREVGRTPRARAPNAAIVVAGFMRRRRPPRRARRAGPARASSRRSDTAARSRA